MSTPVIAFANHVLATAPWAKDALRPFAGRQVAWVTPVGRFRLSLTAEGGVGPAGADVDPDLVVMGDPVVLARLAAGDVTARGDLRVEGDDALARALWHVASRLRWDYEEDLSRLTGDIVAHRIGEALRTLGATARDSIERVGRTAAEYVTEEARLTPPAAEISAWLDDVDILRDDLDRLEQRITRLERAAS
ncbi:MAG: hypothetical protein U1F52_13520 [Burkholderiales bacterium]